MAFAFLSGVLAGVAIVELLLPGRQIYHAGWFNVLLLAIVITATFGAQKTIRAHARRAAIAAVACGALICGLATIANGLFAPDVRTLVGAPGQRVRDPDLGVVVVFPLLSDDPSGNERVGYEGGPLLGYLLRPVQRDVVAVEARDGRGSRLTITQPTGVAFLSPVLLMQQRQSIAGLNLPYDSFAVPAAHRVVKAVLFTPQQAAMLRGMEGLGVPAVLFAVDDENDRPLPGAIKLCVDGQSVAVGGLLLHAAVLRYPAVEIVAVPPIPAVALGALLVVGGMAWAAAGAGDTGRRAIA